MKLTYDDLNMCLDSLSVLMERDDIPFDTALKISKNAMEIKQYLKHYRQECFKLYEQYIEKDPDTGEFSFDIVDGQQRYKIIDGKAEEFKEKNESLLKFDVDVDIKMIKSEELKDIKIAPKILSGILFMLEE